MTISGKSLAGVVRHYSQERPSGPNGMLEQQNELNTAENWINLPTTDLIQPKLKR
jgi:hypothetical protein